MKVAGKRADIEIYGGAGHAFENRANRGYRPRLPPTRGLARSNSSSKKSK
jgi:dienelactone hydrolase